MENIVIITNNALEVILVVHCGCQVST